MAFNADHVIINSRDMLDPLNMTHQSFTVQLQNPVQNFDYFQLINVMLPNTYYNITNKIGNTTLTINGTPYSITPGNYDLSNIIAAYNAAISPSIPGFNISFNIIASNLSITSTNPITINFSQNPATGQLLGFPPIDVTGSNSYQGKFPPSISPLGILINLDCVASTTSISNLQGLRSSSFMINNNSNALEYTMFFENTMFTHSVRSNKNIINTISVKLYDLAGNVLENAGPWILVLRFVRKKPNSPGY